MVFNNRKTVAVLFNAEDRGVLRINGRLHRTPDSLLLDKALKAKNFDLFEVGEGPEWFEDSRNFIWFSEAKKSTPYLYASRAHHADVIIRVSKNLTENGYGEGFTFSKITKRKTERETLDALTLEGTLRCEELLMAVGRFEGGIINDKYCIKKSRIA